MFLMRGSRKFIKESDRNLKKKENMWAAHPIRMHFMQEHRRATDSVKKQQRFRFWWVRYLVSLLPLPQHRMISTA